MPWPTPQDYNEAIQNPRVCFSDPTLRAGIVDLTPLGLPRPITGNFASVYRLRCSGRDWAVRCFWREYADMQERYAAISDHLKWAGLPYTIGFEYLPEGIRIRGQWYPILKMEWVDGSLLDEHLRRHSSDSAALRQLADRWLVMIGAFQRAEIAHGDLQHGNVMVVDGDFKLVDYDCMYVPALRGRMSHEIGHQNYQHPRRGVADFGPALDRFSALVIYLSLVALSTDAALGTSFHAGDECLLLRKQDFENPNASSTFSTLMVQENPRVRSLAEGVRHCLDVEPLRVPPLGSLAGGTTNAFPANRRLSRLFPWSTRIALRAVQQELSPAADAVPVSTGPPAWVVPHLVEPAAPHFFTSARRDAQLCLLAFFPIILGLLLSFVLGALPGRLTGTAGAGLAGLDFVVLLLLYGHDPAAAGKRRLLARRRRLLRRLISLRRAIRTCEDANARVLKRREGADRCYLAKSVRIEDRARRKRSVAQAVLDDTQAFIEKAREHIDRSEEEARRDALLTLQVGHLDLFLRQRRLRSASLPGVDWFTKASLWIFGVRSAADVRSQKVRAFRRIDPAAARAIIAWRAQGQAEASRCSPRKLPPSVADSIAAHLGPSRLGLERCLETVRCSRESLLQAVEDVSAAERCSLQAWRKAMVDRHVASLQQLDARLASLWQDKSTVLADLAQTFRDLEPFRGIALNRYILFLLMKLLIGKV